MEHWMRCSQGCIAWIRSIFSSEIVIISWGGGYFAFLFCLLLQVPKCILIISRRLLVGSAIFELNQNQI